MSDSLSEQLARLGIRPGPAGALPSSIADQVEEVLSGALPWQLPDKDWHPTLIWQANDLHHTLEAWMLRIAGKLARHGLQLSHEFRTPQVPDGSYYVFDGERVESKGPCKHMLVRVNESVDKLMCRQCNMPVNPIWWINQFTDKIAKAESWRLHTMQERTKILREIDELKAERKKLKGAVRRGKESDRKAKAKKPSV